ncbi:glycosyltransferase family 4 protein [Desulfosediminicola flagellatus]|uniref:glycosyltransferase family 4 protein n=1 Tax=Desulfosediminicola flagellatus TaxID=2569541 RepID=UPI0010AD7BD5|nr:glycosyltransferase [Desulfosediminicola flagellatus]
MRVLWFSPTKSLFESRISGHNGGGWISSLEEQIRAQSSVELGVVFEYDSSVDSSVVEGVTYYPLHITQKNRKKRLAVAIDQSLKIIDDFQPDLIQFFGSEWWYGLLAGHTDIPCLVHMQGSLPSCYNARYPAGFSVWNKLLSRHTSFRQKLMAFRVDSTFWKNAEQEVRILKVNRYFMGRTHWDQSIVRFYNPEATYFTCQEMLRSSFIKSEQSWTYQAGALKVISTISGPLYKGMDLILKTARLLKEHTDLVFEWSVCGVHEARLMESLYGIEANSVGVNLLGVVSQEELVDRLLDSTIYVHPSYIDNSPNSICEAQVLGVPVITTDVGGTSSLVEDGHSGYLVPANDPLKLADLVMQLQADSEKLSELSVNCRATALQRHNPQEIIETLLEIYQQVRRSFLERSNFGGLDE